MVLTQFLRPPIQCLAVVAALAACEALAPPSPLPEGAVSMSPPAGFTEWWSQTESCSGLSGHLRGIEWYVVPGAASFETGDGPKVGLWSRSTAGTRIILAGQYAGSELVVRHEMLHELLRVEGHPPEYFVDRCHLTWESWGAGEGLGEESY